jgi:phosphopantothenoylcysteine decarboxylase/phosphopantothenate--cysteine ligase
LEQALAVLQPQASAIAMAAAVADHRRTAPLLDKLSKRELESQLSTGWQAVPDLLAGLVERRAPGQAILGFAAFSGDGLAEAQRKLQRKGCDLLFANPIDRPGVGFGAAANEGWLLAADGRQWRVEPSGKLAVAHRLLTSLADVLSPQDQAARG